MHFDWGTILGPIIGLVATGVGAFFAHRISSPSDMERAQLLAHIAQDAAALVVSLNPKLTWAQTVEAVVQQIIAAAGVPTTNRNAIERAATGALVKLGKSPTNG